MTRAALVLGVALALVPAAAAVAHKGHQASPSPAAPDVEVDDSTGAAEPSGDPSADPSEPVAAVSDPPAEALPPEEGERSAFEVIPWRTAVTGHLHNKIVHFPLAFGLAAGVMLIVAPRWPAYEPAARVLLVIAAALAVAAYFSGQAQEEAFEDSPFHSVVELHERFGTISGLTLLAGAALSFWTAARRFLPVYGVVLIAVLAFTGFLGGVLSHS